MADARTFLVTGCASGIGLDLVDLLVERGIGHVLATDLRSDVVAAQLAAGRWPEGRVAAETLDVTHPEDWERALDVAERRFGPVDALANVAGFLAPAWVHEAHPADVARQIDVNVKGVVLGTRFAGARMAARGRGNIVNVASLAGLAPVPGIAVYSATKYAVRGFTLAAAQELAAHGVRVSLVCPDAVNTPMLDLQRGREETLLTFSGPRTLAPREVSRAIVRAVDTGVRELYLPRARGWLARFADVFPGSAPLLVPALRARGRRRQSGGA